MAYAKARSGLRHFKVRLQFLFEPVSERGSRTYILPTGFGSAYGMVVVTLLTMAMGYGNNLIYMYVFGLIGLTFTSIYITNENIKRLKLELVPAKLIFAREDSVLSVSIQNPASRASYDLILGAGKAPLRTEVPLCPPQQNTIARVAWFANERGYQQAPVLGLHSSFPFGLFRAWKVRRRLEPVLVFPARIGEREFPSGAGAEQELGVMGVFRGHRDYTTTDSPRRVDWRASAKYQSVLVKTFEDAEQSSLSFSWEQTTHLAEFEDRISQLTLWITEAENQGQLYSLELKNLELSASQGDEHLRRCLTALALLKREDTV